LKKLVSQGLILFFKKGEMGNFGTSNSSRAHPKTSKKIVVDTWISDRYLIGRTLGKGASSMVVEVTELNTGKRFALKIMDKFDRLNKGYYMRETKILKMSHHPNIAAFKEAYVGSKHFYIISEMGEGGDLYERMIDRNWSITEKRASELVKTMLLVIGYLHGKNIVHRDLKPENFVFKTKDPDSDILLIDFGCARIVRDDVKYRNAFGTPYFVAPEVVSPRKYNRGGNTLKFSDVWSLGVIAYTLMVGQVPFSGISVTDIFTSILKNPLRFPEDGIHLTKSFINFCERLLTKSPYKRLKVEEALVHEWLRNTTDEKLEVVRSSSKSEIHDEALALVKSLASTAHVYRVGAELYILGTGPYLEDVCESILV